MEMVSPNRAQEPQYQPLVRQGSVYNLTFDEVQSQLGNTRKPLHSMNLDELLKNVISAESGQLVQNPSSDSFLLGNTSALNETSSNKTINEVFRDIVIQEHVNGSVDNNNLQQSILRETTLEDFLARAGVINIGNQDNVNVTSDAAQPLMAMDPMVIANSQPEDWLPRQMQMSMPMPTIHIQKHHEQQSQPIIGLCPDFSAAESVYESSVTEIDYSENSPAMSMPMVATMSSSSTCSDSSGIAAVGKKHRYSESDEMLEKTIERRQKRMAKNRESAARSRAKKQEHINNLLHAKFHLEKTKSELLKQKSAGTKPRWGWQPSRLKTFLEEVDERLFPPSTLTPTYQLRRTSSTKF